MAKAKPEVVVEEETHEEPAGKPAKTSKETKSEGTDWKKLLIVAAFAVGGLFLIFRRNDGEKTTPAAEKPAADTAAKPARGRFSVLDRL